MAYSELLHSKSKSNRKKEGIYYTPDDYCEALAFWAIQTKTDRILEPSFGGGAFLKVSHSKLCLLGAKSPKRLLWGYDTDVEAHTSLKSSLFCNSEKLFHKDFLTASEKELGGKVDVILGNPPYIGWKMLSSKQREEAIRVCPEQYTPMRQANLWVFFCLKSLQLLNAKGRFAMVLPRSLIFSDYGKSFLNYFKTQFERVCVIESNESCFKYCGAAERPIILLGENHKVASCLEIQKHRVSSADEIPSKINSPQSSCEQESNHTLARKIFTDALFLGDLFDVRIGIVTGDNDFFLFSEDKRKELNIPKKFMLPIIAKSRDLKRLMYTSTDIESTEEKLSIYMLDTRAGSSANPIKKHLDSYPKQRIEENRTFGKVAVWHMPTIGPEPSAFFSYMTNTGPRLVLNTAKVQCVNSIHRLYHKNRDTSEMKWCSLYVFSVYGRLASEYVGRTYASGLLKLEPSDVKRLPLFTPDKTEFSSQRFKKSWTKINALLKNDESSKAYDRCNDYVHEVVSEMIPSIPTIQELHSLREKLAAIRTLRD